MIILGITYSHDGTLTIFKDGKNIFSIAEERLNRQKAYIGFPFLSLKYVVEKSLVDPKEIDFVAVPINNFTANGAWIQAFELTENKKYFDIQNDAKPEDFYMDDESWREIKTSQACKAYVERKIRSLLENVGIRAPIKFVDHHLSHAASAYYSCGKSKVLAITLDAVGDNKSGTINICDNGELTDIHSEPVGSSLGLLYSATTKKCGFKISRHEGKITGLAAYGDKGSVKLFANELNVVDGGFVYPNINYGLISRVHRKIKRMFMGQDADPWMKLLEKKAGDLSHEDLAAAIQFLLEMRIKEHVSYWVDKTGIRDVVLAGGVFANVRFNQEVAELPNVDSLFIYPNMGDGGLGFGAAAVCYYENETFQPEQARLENVYLGPSFSSSEIEVLLGKHQDISFNKSDCLEKEVAAMLHAGKVVGWFQGRMEYGPRALGNRSILARATDKEINNWLNEKLERTEFMPFAPSCIYEKAHEVFCIEKESLMKTAEFMTITFDVKPEWVDRVPAIAHLDNTARPQLVREEVNGKYYHLLQAYHAISGIPLIINTSFNAHEEPIVCQPEEGLSVLLDGRIDVLVIDDFICKRRVSS